VAASGRNGGVQLRVWEHKQTDCDRDKQLLYYKPLQYGAFACSVRRLVAAEPQCCSALCGLFTHHLAAAMSSVNSPCTWTGPACCCNHRCGSRRRASTSGASSLSAHCMPDRPTHAAAQRMLTNVVHVWAACAAL
jgi:hypothetical protein